MKLSSEDVLKDIDSYRKITPQKNINFAGFFVCFAPSVSTDT